MLEHARARRVQPVEPRVLVDGGVAQVLLPGRARATTTPSLPSRMSFGVQLGLLFALATAFASVVGFLYKHRGAVESPPVEPRRPVRTSLALFRSRWYTIGILVATASWGFHVAALALAPISLVQSVIAGGLVLLTVVADRLFGLDVTRREWIGVGADGGGPRVPGGHARRRRRQRPQRLRHRHARRSTRASRRRSASAPPWPAATGTGHGIPLALSAGLLWGASDVSIKALSDHLGDDGVARARCTRSR